MAKKLSQAVSLDFRSNTPIPSWVKDVIDAHLEIEAEDAKSAGSLGFMARAMVIATMPYKDPKTDSFTRINGDFRLRILAGYEGGIPFGIYPRLLMSWVATEAVRKQSPVIQLGDSLKTFLHDVMDLKSTGGGNRGSGGRVVEQMKRLFGSMITAQYGGTLENRGFALRNVLIADSLELDEHEVDSFDGSEKKKLKSEVKSEALWVPQAKDEAGAWKSNVRLSNNFFKECITSPVPIDLRAFKALRASPLAMDVYSWLTYRLSYTSKRSRPIPWESLMLQFGSNFNSDDAGQATRNFKKQFLKALRMVEVVYPQARFEINENGFVLLPSRPHILPAEKQSKLFE
jgi:hypothetical protein